MNAPSPLCLREIQDLAESLAPCDGSNATGLPQVRIVKMAPLASDAFLLVRPGITFLLRAPCDATSDSELKVSGHNNVFVASVPIPVPTTGRSIPVKTRLMVHVEFEAATLDRVLPSIVDPDQKGSQTSPPRGLVSIEMNQETEDVLVRLLTALHDPVDAAVLGERHSCRAVPSNTNCTFARRYLEGAACKQ